MGGRLAVIAAIAAIAAACRREQPSAAPHAEPPAPVVPHDVARQSGPPDASVTVRLALPPIDPAVQGRVCSALRRASGYGYGLHDDPHVELPACARIDRERRATLDALRREVHERGAYPVFRQCVAARGGAWSIVLTSYRLAAADAGDFSVTGELSLVHATSDGRLATAVLPPVQASPADEMSVRALDSFDYDGDGADEIFVRENGTMRIFTFHGGAVAPYAPAASLGPLDAVRDVDLDGRPDPSVAEGYAPVRDGLISLYAHSLPDGTFSTTDEVARAVLACECESMPTRIEPAPRHRPQFGADDIPPGGDIVCARLWGASADQVIAMIDAACVNANASAPVPGSICASRARYDAIARLEPPVRIR